MGLTSKVSMQRFDFVWICGAVLHGIACIFMMYFSLCVWRIDGVMRTMNTEKLLKTLPIIQNQLDALLDFDVSSRIVFYCYNPLLVYGVGRNILRFCSLLLWLLFLISPLSAQANPNELTNGVINAAFMLLFKDSIRLFAAYNEGIINLLGMWYSK